MMIGTKAFEAMKKIIAISAFAMLFASCTVELIDPVTEEVSIKKPDSITANAPVETKTTVDGVTVKWAAGDAITVFTTDDSAIGFDIDEGAGTSSATFTGDLGGKDYGDFIVYPHDGSNAKADEIVDVKYKDTYTYGNAPLPMLGTKSSGTSYTFEHIGGAFRIQYKNVPSTAATFEFEEISATPQKICGVYEITDVTSSVSGSFYSGSSKVTITSLPGTSDLEFVIPVPAGSYKFSVCLKDSGGNVIHASSKTVGSAKTISVGHIKNVGAIILPTAVTVTKSISALCTDSDDTTVVTPLDLNGDGIISIGQTGNGNNGKYYKSDHSLRYYTDGAMTISLTGSYKLQKVNITFSGALTGLTSGSDVEASGTSASYACTSNAKVTSISVTYIATTNTVEPSKVPTPVITDSENVVTITCALAGASIYYTDDGTTPSSSSTLYDGPFAVGANCTIKAIAYKAGYGDSAVSSGHDVTYSSLTCATPAISCSSNVVTITCATEGASIYYTTNGTSPTTSSTLYSGVFGIADDCTVKAIAVKLGRANSSVASKDCDYVTKTPNTTIFHETFGNNTGSARDWNDSYSVKSGVSSAYSGITSYTVTNAKQGKNTTGSTQSGLNQSTSGTDAVLIIGPLNVVAAESMVVTYQWKAGSVKETYTTSLYYKTSSGGSFTEVSGTGAGVASSFVTRSYNLPVAAQVSTLYLKVVWNTSNTQAIIDEFDINGTI